jgi:hypothetical protein
MPEARNWSVGSSSRFRTKAAAMPRGHCCGLAFDDRLLLHVDFGQTVDYHASKNRWPSMVQRREIGVIVCCIGMSGRIEQVGLLLRHRF